MSISGKRVHALRKEMGYTMEELGQRCGVKKSAVCKWEHETVDSIPYSTMQLLSTVLDCSPAYLTGESDERYEQYSSAEDMLARYTDFSDIVITITKKARRMSQDKQQRLLEFAKLIEEGRL